MLGWNTDECLQGVVGAIPGIGKSPAKGQQQKQDGDRKATPEGAVTPTPTERVTLPLLLGISVKAARGVRPNSGRQPSAEKLDQRDSEPSYGPVRNAAIAPPLVDAPARLQLVA